MSDRGREPIRSGPARLDVQGLVVRFGGVRAVDDVDLVAEAGSIVGLIGPNGSGKSTTLDAVSGLVNPVAGSIRIDGTDLIDYLPEERIELRVVRSFQDCRLFPELPWRTRCCCAKTPATRLVSCRPPFSCPGRVVANGKAARGRGRHRIIRPEPLPASTAPPICPPARVGWWTSRRSSWSTSAAPARRADCGNRSAGGGGVRSAAPTGARGGRHHDLLVEHDVRCLRTVFEGGRHGDGTDRRGRHARRGQTRSLGNRDLSRRE